MTSNAESSVVVEHEQITEIPLEQLCDFKNHPFKVTPDDNFKKLMDSIKSFGVLSPVIARPKPDGGFELVSGHRRKAACEAIGIKKMPVLIREMTDDEAVVMMVDSNIQRESLLPSEKAFAYRMKLAVLKHQGKSMNSTSGQVVQKSKLSVEVLAERSGENYKQIQRYIRLTELHPAILKMVDDKKIAFNPAVEISFLRISEQLELHDAMMREQATPSLSQARLMKNLSVENKLSTEEINRIISKPKGNQREQYVFFNSTFAEFFPIHYTGRQMEDTIKALLAQWQIQQKSKQYHER